MGNPEPAAAKRWEDFKPRAVTGCLCLAGGLVCFVVARLLWTWLMKDPDMCRSRTTGDAYPCLFQFVPAYLFYAIALGTVIAGLVLMVQALQLYAADRRGLRSAAGAVDEAARSGNQGLLMEALVSEDRYVRAKAADAFGRRRDSTAVGPLLQALADRDGIVQRSAAKALGSIKDAAAVEPLIRVLKEGDAHAQAAWALGELGDSRAVRPLVDVLVEKGASGPFSAREAAEALVKFGGEAVAPLVQALDHGSGQGRRAAAEVLGNIGDARAVEPLVRALRDPDGQLRRIAADALGRIGDTRAVEELTRTARDREEAVRDTAKRALRRIAAHPVTRFVCPRCGREVKPGARFCTGCGARFSQ
jgi:hypothetical protein